MWNCVPLRPRKPRLCNVWILVNTYLGILFPMRKLFLCSFWKVHAVQQSAPEVLKLIFPQHGNTHADQEKEIINCMLVWKVYIQILKFQSPYCTSPSYTLRTTGADDPAGSRGRKGRPRWTAPISRSQLFAGLILDFTYFNQSISRCITIPTYLWWWDACLITGRSCWRIYSSFL